MYIYPHSKILKAKEKAPLLSYLAELMSKGYEEYQPYHHASFSHSPSFYYRWTIRYYRLGSITVISNFIDFITQFTTLRSSYRPELSDCKQPLRTNGL